MNRKLTLKITGMTCDGCATTIKSFLEQEEGIVKADISYPERSGEIIYDSSSTKKEDIVRGKIFSGAYNAEIVKDEAD